MTREDAQALLAELDDLEIRVQAQVHRLGGQDQDIADLTHDLAARRALIVEYLALSRLVDAADGSTIH